MNKTLSFLFIALLLAFVGMSADANAQRAVLKNNNPVGSTCAPSAGFVLSNGTAVAVATLPPQQTIGIILPPGVTVVSLIIGGQNWAPPPPFACYFTGVTCPTSICGTGVNRWSFN